MNTTMRWFALLVVFSTITLLTATCFSTERVLRVSDGRIIGFDQMIGELKGTTVVFVGEIHDFKEHHAAELEIIQALQRKGASLAIGLEMFTAESQRDLDLWVSGRMAEERFIERYYENWRMQWPLYGDIFLYARRNSIPMVGLNVPRDIAQKVASTGFASLSRAEKEKLPPGITCSVDAPYMEFIRKSYAEHGKEKDGRSFVNFCEAQMLWNKTMAWHLMKYLEKIPHKTVVVIAGVGHAMKRGIAAYLDERGGLGYKVILPEVSGIPTSAITNEDADYILLNR